MVYQGVCVHKRLNEITTYQIELPIEKVVLGLPLTTVNRSGMLPPGFIAVEPPEVYEIYELDMAA
jgi:hypothetical protein